MTPESFLVGRLGGWGAVRGFSGAILRRFTLQMHGVWSEEHQALHLDETYAYLDGKTFQRRWAVHTTAEGLIVADDALEAASLRGRQIGTDFELSFERLVPEAGLFRSSRQVVRFVAIDGDHALMLGRVRRLGIVLATLHVALQRL